MQAPPANAGPHTIPQSNPGNIMHGMQMLQQAAMLLTQAIPIIPMGSPLHQKIMKIATDLTKEIGDLKQNMQQQVQTLLQQVQAAKAAGQNQMPPGGAPPPPNQGPAMAPPPAGGGAPPPGM